MAMRPVRGFERPPLQWMFVGASVVLVAVVVVGAVELRRERARRETIHAAALEGRVERQELEMRLAREQSAREALSLEVARLRGGAGVDGKPAALPTLTLTPISTASPTPPEPSVERPSPDQVIALRLVLPARTDVGRTFTISIRNWSDGAVVWTRGNLAAAAVEGQSMVIARVTGDVLSVGAYEVTVSGEGQPSGAVASYQVAVGNGV